MNSTLSKNIPSQLIHPSAQIHHTTIIEQGAEIAENVHIGPYCYIGPKVKLKPNVRLVSHVSLAGDILLGERTIVYPFASLGHPPQDLKYKGEASETIIGCDTTIREYVTIQPGTQGDKMMTKVGNHCLLMVSSHVAHDCIVGNHVILANNATLAGHVQVEDHVIIGGLSAIQQHVRIGEHAIIGGMSGVEKDIIPYAMVMGERAYLKGLNLVGLKRRGFTADLIQDLMKAYQELFEDNNHLPLIDRINKIETDFCNSSIVSQLVNFLKLSSKRPLCLPKT